MARPRAEPAVDPATGRLLPDGVQYRGVRQCFARKLVKGRRVAKSFEAAKQAAYWLKAVDVDRKRGVFLDMSVAEKHSLGNVLRSYQLEVLGDDPSREVIFEDGRTCPYRAMTPVTERKSTDLLGAQQEIGFIDVILRDDACAFRMAALTGAEVAARCGGGFTPFGASRSMVARLF